ncbi:hypothetical protein Trydic_g251 [Trypoxylus dichotomus]
MFVPKISNFINKPSWLHSEGVICNQGANYIVRYVGCLEVKISTRALDFKTRSTVAKVCIIKVSEAAGLRAVKKKRKFDKNILRAVADRPRLEYAGTDANLNITSSKLIITSLRTQTVIVSHDMPCISFASGGDSDTEEFVAYIAKDATEWRACYVLECGGSLARNVISTIGQAFEVRYIQSCRSATFAMALACSSSRSTSNTDRDYYNDFPARIPPEFAIINFGRPPLPPPLPPPPLRRSAAVPSTSTAPPGECPNLIDLNSDSALASCSHEYVNESILSERDVFDMQPFVRPSVPKRMNPAQLRELSNQLWFHGYLSRGEAEKLLVNNGDFLVRNSSTSEGQYVLSGMVNNVKKHLFLIEMDGTIRSRGYTFRSVNHLIEYHLDNAIPVVSAGTAVVLKVPVLRKYNF